MHRSSIALTILFARSVLVVAQADPTHGLMGYRTPTIDRLADEGMMFTDPMASNRVRLATDTEDIPHSRSH